MNYKDLKAVKDDVEANGNVLTLKVEALRLAYGAGKMGKHVAANISDDLAGMGIRHYPVELPVYSYESVRLYKSGSPVGKVIEAVLDFGDSQDELLREVSTGEDAMMIRRIRELVCN